MRWPMMLQRTLIALSGIRIVLRALVVKSISELLAFARTCFCSRRCFALRHCEMLLAVEFDLILRSFAREQEQIGEREQSVETGCTAFKSFSTSAKEK